MLLNEPEKEEDKLSPSLFNLVDLITNSLSSKNTQTVITALKLVSLILDKNHVYAVSTLVRSLPCRNQSPQRTIGGLDVEVDAYLALAEDIGGGEELEEAYGSHLSDIQMLLETHPCSMRFLLPPGVTNPTASQHPSSTLCLKPVDIHYLSNDDPMFTSLLRLLQTFFTNNVETNLGLTDAIINLASCPCIRLEGWLAIDPSKYQFPDQPNDLQSPSQTTYATPPAMHSESKFEALHLARRHPTFAIRDTPRLLSILRNLLSQLRLLHHEIPGLDTLIQNRKEVFQITESLDAVTEPPPPPYSSRPSLDISSTTAAVALESNTGRAPLVPKLESVSHHALARSASPSRSRTASPRGRSVRSEVASSAGSSSPAPVPAASSSRRREAANAAGALSPTARGTVSPRGAATPRSVGFQQLSPAVAELDAKVLRKRVKLPLKSAEGSEEQRKSEGAEGAVEQEHEDGSGKEEGREASLNHVLTNIVILQEFILEIAAVLQARGNLFEDVRFV